MNTEDKIFGTHNGGDTLEKGMRLFYAVIFRKWWQGYTTQNHGGVAFSDKGAWLAACKRMQLIIHSFEIETRVRFESIERNMHFLRDYTPAQVAKALEKETERRNAKLSPLGELASTGASEIKLNFRWKDLRALADM